MTQITDSDANKQPAIGAGAAEEEEEEGGGGGESKGHHLWPWGDGRE